MENPPKGKCAGWRTRNFVCFMLFLGIANSYVMKTNLSVAIVAMVNHTAVDNEEQIVQHECSQQYDATEDAAFEDGEFVWPVTTQGYILSTFFIGYVLTQIPVGILSKRFGAKYFLGVGMLINSLLSFVIPISAKGFGPWGLCLVRFTQGVCEGPIVPCSHVLLAKWIPPNERSRMGACVYAGAQFGTIVSMPLSGLLAKHGFDGGWPSIFYVFGIVGTLWAIIFLVFVYEDPFSHPSITEDERNYIISQIGDDNQAKNPRFPCESVSKSLPFYAILIAHIGHNYGYETLMTELPTYMKQVLRLSLTANGCLSSLPYLAMWIFSMLISIVADCLINRKYLSRTATRKLVNSIGEYGPGVALILVSYSGCNRFLAIVFLTLGVGLNGGIYSGFKINHIDLTSKFAGILMSITNCSANIIGLIAPVIVSHIVAHDQSINQWRIVFFLAGFVYIGCGTFYNVFASGEKQEWDNAADLAAKTSK